MSNQGVFSVARGKNLGEARRGEDDDGDPIVQGETTKVQIDNRYFDKLKARLGQQPKSTSLTPEEAAWASKLLGPEDEKRPPGLVIYNDDGSVYKRPN